MSRRQGPPAEGVLDFVRTSAPEFLAPSWAAWREVLARVTPGVRELWAAAGRGSGKSRVSALLAACYATREWPRAPGERVFAAVIAPDRRQAAITHGYVRGLLPPGLVEEDKQESIVLKNGVTVEVVTASVAAPRGRSYCLAIVEESAFLPTEESANPDTEVLRALRPGLARVPGSLLVVVSSPYARRGELWRAACRWRETGGDDSHVFVQADTMSLNPTFDRKEIERAHAEDPASAAAEYGAEFRGDVSSLFSWDALRAVTVPGRLELPPEEGVTYEGFVDPSGGSADSFSLAVTHTAASRARVLDAVREWRPPFSPESVVEETCALLRAYRLVKVTGDRYGGEWPRERFRKHGVEYVPSERNKSEIYLESLPLVNAGKVELLDLPRLLQQAAGLERRTARGGKDSVDHGPGGHDDLVNSALAALLLTRGDRPSLRFDIYGKRKTGFDDEGREWRGGAPWNGSFMPQRDALGRPCTPMERFVDGKKQPWTPEDWARPVPDLPKKRKVPDLYWG